MSSVTREQLLGSFKRRIIPVDVPHLGRVYLRNLNDGQKSQFEAGSVTEEGKVNLAAIRSQRRRLIALTVCDESGQPILIEKGDVEQLHKVDASITSYLFDRAQKHCGFDVDQQKDAEKNSDEAGDYDSAIDSPSAGESST